MDLEMKVTSLELQTMFEFIDPSGSNVCNNETAALYYDKDLAEPYVQTENSTIQLVDLVTG